MDLADFVKRSHSSSFFLQISLSDHLSCRLSWCHRVQALLVGIDDIDLSRGLCMYSIDPSGSWQSWGSGAAIGKFAKQLRQEIATKQKEAPSSLDTALSQLISCWVNTCKAENVNLESSEEYEALILHRNAETKECSLYKVDEKQVQKIVAKHVSAARLP